MQLTAPSTPVSKTSLWAGRILSALPVLLFGLTGMFALIKPAAAAEGFSHFGYPEGTMPRIVFVELACAILYAIPRTSVLGAILLTGYVGGMIATHIRVGEPFFPAIVAGVLVWAGLFLRDARLRALLPLRS